MMDRWTHGFERQLKARPCLFQPSGPPLLTQAQYVGPTFPISVGSHRPGPPHVGLP
jgi:hypothetical protein